MTTQWSRDAGPNKQYPGDPEGFETYETDKDAWLVVNNFADHINSRPPASLPRVLARYTVADNVHDDPHGPAGTVVPTESGAAYARRCVADTAIGTQCWARAITGYSVNARAIALTVTKHNARQLFTTIKRDCGDRTSKQSSNLVKTFHAKRKGQTPIKTFNTDWVDGARTLKANGMELPDTYLVNLYLSSLGDQYATIGTVVHAMPASERTLAKIMKMAEDHTIADTDEPDISVAMLTQLEEQGFVVTKRQAETSEFVTKRHKSNRGYAQVANSNTPDTHASECELCGMKYHTQSTCFAHGGGLSHLAAHERRAWIHAKRKAKNEGRPMPTTWPLPQQTNTGRAAAAHTTTQDLTERLAVRDAQIQKIQSIYMSSPAHIDEFNTGILEASWKPF